MKRLVVVMMLLAQPALAERGEYYGHMMDGGYGYGIGMMFGPVLWLIVLGLIVAGIVWFVRRTEVAAGRKPQSDALAELDLRLARGEIEADDYTARKKLLTA